MNYVCFGQDVEIVENTAHKAVPKETNRCSYAVAYSIYM